MPTTRMMRMKATPLRKAKLLGLGCLVKYDGDGQCTLRNTSLKFILPEFVDDVLKSIVVRNHHSYATSTVAVLMFVMPHIQTFLPSLFLSICYDKNVFQISHFSSRTLVYGTSSWFHKLQL